MAVVLAFFLVVVIGELAAGWLSEWLCWALVADGKSQRDDALRSFFLHEARTRLLFCTCRGWGGGSRVAILAELGAVAGLGDRGLPHSEFARPPGRVCEHLRVAAASSQTPPAHTQQSPHRHAAPHAPARALSPAHLPQRYPPTSAALCTRLD